MNFSLTLFSWLCILQQTRLASAVLLAEWDLCCISKSSLCCSLPLWMEDSHSPWFLSTHTHIHYKWIRTQLAWRINKLQTRLLLCYKVVDINQKVHLFSCDDQDWLNIFGIIKTRWRLYRPALCINGLKNPNPFNYLKLTINNTYLYLFINIYLYIISRFYILFILIYWRLNVYIYL